MQEAFQKNKRDQCEELFSQDKTLKMRTYGHIRDKLFIKPSKPSRNSDTNVNIKDKTHLWGSKLGLALFDVAKVILFTYY
jgi:hypothetical protein